MDTNTCSETISKSEIQIAEKRNTSKLFSVPKKKNLQLIKNKIISEEWASTDWRKSELGSTSTIRLMANITITNQHTKGIKNGWNDFYWTPWKSFLATRSKKI